MVPVPSDTMTFIRAAREQSFDYEGWYTVIADPEVQVDYVYGYGAKDYDAVAEMFYADYVLQHAEHAALVWHDADCCKVMLVR